MATLHFSRSQTVRLKAISGIVLLLLLTSLYTLQGCDSVKQSSSQNKGNTLVVVVIDTVGYNRVLENPEQAPFLRSLTRSSAIFTNAFSTAPWTRASRTNTGAGISISTPGSSFTAVPGPLVSAFWTMRYPYAMTRCQSLSAKASTPGSTRLSCLW